MYEICSFIIVLRTAIWLNHLYYRCLFRMSKSMINWCLLRMCKSMINQSHFNPKLVGVFIYLPLGTLQPNNFNIRRTIPQKSGLGLRTYGLLDPTCGTTMGMLLFITNENICQNKSISDNQKLIFSLVAQCCVLVHVYIISAFEFYMWKKRFCCIKLIPILVIWCESFGKIVPLKRKVAATTQGVEQYSSLLII